MQNHCFHLNTLSLVRVTGDDASVFLQGQLTADVLQLKEKEAVLAACCSAKGRIIANFWLWREADDYLFALPQSMVETLLTHLQKFAVFSKVSLQEQAQDIYGITSSDPTNTEAIVLHGWPGHYLSLEPGTPASDNSAWESAAIKAGLVYITPNISDSLLPQMIKLANFGGLSFTKGCYVGQEIIARTEHLGTLKRHLFYGEIAGSAEISVGKSLVDDSDNALGVIVACHAQEHCQQILAVIQQRAIDADIKLKTTDSNELTHQQRL